MSLKLRLLLLSLLGLALVAGGWAAWLWTQPPSSSAIVSSETRTSGTALIGGPFTLTDHRGERRSEADFEGRYMLIFFGYTYCPDICPTTLTTVSQGLDILAESEAAKAAAVTPVFVSIDPARDTPAALADYMSHFHPAMVALTGSEEEVAVAAKAYRIFYQKVVQEDASDYLMAPDGSYVSHFTHASTAEEIAEGLAKLVDPARAAGA